MRQDSRMRRIFRRFSDSGEGSRTALEKCEQITEGISLPLGDAAPCSSHRQTPLQDLLVPPPGCAVRPDRRCFRQSPRELSEPLAESLVSAGENANQKPFKPITKFLHAIGGHNRREGAQGTRAPSFSIKVVQYPLWQYTQSLQK